MYDNYCERSEGYSGCNFKRVERDRAKMGLTSWAAAAGAAKNRDKGRQLIPLE